MRARGNNLALIFVYSRLQVTTQTKKKGLQCISESKLNFSCTVHCSYKIPYTTKNLQDKIFTNNPSFVLG